MSKVRPLIAVIDDEEPVRKALGRLMQSVGMTVETFSGGGEFLATLDTHRPDCAVLDLHMPEVTGFDVLERIAEMGARVPVVAISGYDLPDAEECAMRGGAAAYLRKPVNQRLLLAAIAAARQEKNGPGLHEKGGKEHEMPVHHLLEQTLNDYIAAAGPQNGLAGAAFFTTKQHLRPISTRNKKMPAQDLNQQLAAVGSIHPAVHVPQNWNYENSPLMYKAYMHPPHDVGGQFDVPVYYEEKEEEEWELNTYTTCETLGSKGIWNSEERRRRADNDLGYTLYMGMPYYGRWLWAATRSLIDKKHFSLAELQEKIAEVKSRYENK